MGGSIKYIHGTCCLDVFPLLRGYSRECGSLYSYSGGGNAERGSVVWVESLEARLHEVMASYVGIYIQLQRVSTWMTFG